jgi:hypothetical protein
MSFRRIYQARTLEAAKVTPVLLGQDFSDRDCRLCMSETENDAIARANRDGAATRECLAYCFDELVELKVRMRVPPAPMNTLIDTEQTVHAQRKALIHGE